MALKFTAQMIISSSRAMEDTFPFALERLGSQLLKECRPDWDTVVIKVEPETIMGDQTWKIRLQCLGGTRDCKVRGA